MQFSEVSELKQFTRLQSYVPVSLLVRDNKTYIPIKTLQDLNLFPLYDLLENSLQVDPQFNLKKPLDLGSSEEKAEDILQEIKTYVTRAELQPLEKFLISKNHRYFIDNELFDTQANEIPLERKDSQFTRNKTVLVSAHKNRTSLQTRINRTASGNIGYVNTAFKDVGKKEEEVKIEDPLLDEEILSYSLDEEASKTIGKPYSYNWIEDDSKKKFKKNAIDFKQPRTKSLLSEQIHHMPPRKFSRLNCFSAGDSRKSSTTKLLSVFFFGTPLNLKIPINNKSSVQEIIITILCYYMNTAPIIDKSLMKYPWLPEAYELRILEDDDDYRPEMSFDPLERNKRFGEYGIESVAFCEIEGFEPFNINVCEEDENEEIKEKENTFKSILDSKHLLLQITIPQHNYSTLIKIDSDKTIKDIFPIIQKKLKFDHKKYKVYEEIGVADEDGLFSADEQEVDINMPLSNLKKNRLKLMKKSFADDGDLTQNATSKNSMIEEIRDNIFPESFIITEMQALKYEEFELYKINVSKNKKSLRILGVSQFKIFHKFKEIQSIYFFYI